MSENGRQWINLVPDIAGKSLNYGFYTHRTSNFGALSPSPAGEGWGEENQKPNFDVQKVKHAGLNPN